MRKAVALLFIVACGTSLFGQIKHKFLLLDEAGRSILLIDQFNPSNNWKMTPPGYHRDLQLVGNNRVMVVLEEEGGFIELNLATGAVVRTCLGLVRGGHGVSGRRLPSGKTILCGNGIDPSSGDISVIEIDSAGVNKRKICTYTGYNNMRLMRRTFLGTYMFGKNGGPICEGDSTGKVIWEKQVPLAPENAYMGVRLKNGNVLASSGYGKTVVEMKSDGSVVRTYGGATQPGADSIYPNFYCMFQVLQNKNLVVVNWVGHGGTRTKCRQIMEYDTTGKMVWTWDDTTLIKSLHGALIIDSLDTKYLYDDRNGGVLTPDTIPRPVTVRDFPSRSVVDDPVFSFSGTTGNAKTISYSVSGASLVTIGIYTVRGQLLKTLNDSWQQPGRYHITLEKKAFINGCFILSFRAGKTIINRRISDF